MRMYTFDPKGPPKESMVDCKSMELGIPHVAQGSNHCLSSLVSKSAQTVCKVLYKLLRTSSLANWHRRLSNTQKHLATRHR